ncbi:MAG: hypothetical protein ACK2T3_03765 [Candidatus Promineifilaceae bacterium]
MSKADKSLTTNCPSCDAIIRLSRRPRLGAIIVCQECDESFEVVSITPLQLNWSLPDDDDEYWTGEDKDDYDDQYDRYTPYSWA